MGSAICLGMGQCFVLELVAGYASPSLPAATDAAPPNETRVEGRSACHPRVFLHRVVLLSSCMHPLMSGDASCAVPQAVVLPGELWRWVFGYGCRS
jgi:hypothetical protein